MYRVEFIGMRTYLYVCRKRCSEGKITFTAANADAGSFDNAVRLYDIRQGRVGRKKGADTEVYSKQ